jgi:hypothetical protein
MKRVSLILSVVFTVLLAGCFETTDELTLKSDGSGVMTTTNDMSMLISMAKSMGGADQMKGADKATDTVVSLSSLADSISSLSPQEKDLIKNGKLGLNINMNDEKMIVKLELPFAKVEQIPSIKAVSGKVSQYFIGKSMTQGMPGGMDMDGKMPGLDPLDEFFTTTYTATGIEKKVNKEKYATIETDEAMKGLKEMSEGGMPIKNTVIINLPKAAKLVEGKNAQLSEDKKKVTITCTSEDFFDNPSAMEFKIQY